MSEIPNFSDYTSHGWAICPIPKGIKGPDTKGWNLLKNAIRDTEKASTLRGNAGLLHSYSGTAAFDLDDLEGARAWFAAKGINIDLMLADPENVHLLSGREGRDKLLFQLPEGVEPIITCKVCDPGNSKKTWFELRCAANGGKSVQDVLPPSIHPDTEKPYFWKGDWRALPLLPENLLKVWREILAEKGTAGMTGKASTRPIISDDEDLLAPGEPEEHQHQGEPEAERPDPQPTKPSAPRPEDRGNPSLIAAFEKAHGNPESIRKWLDQKGYTYSGESGGTHRFLWPGSGSGEPGVALFRHRDDRWRVFSHHGGDPLAAEGKPLDALDVRAILFHAGDRKAALAAFDAERDPRPLVKLFQGHLHHASRKVADILGSQAVPVVFQRGGMLTRVAVLPDTLDLGHGTTVPAGSPAIVALSGSDLGIRIMDAVRLQTQKTLPNGEKKWTDTDCPPKLSNAVAAIQGADWKRIQPLIGITESPIIRPDGAVHDHAGYDPVSRLYYDGRCPRLEYLAKTVSRDDAVAATEYLLRPFGQFPFSLQTDKSVLLSLLLTLALRAQLPFAPMYAAGATAPASGKGLLFEASNVLIRGRYPATMCVPDSGNDDETRKAITSLLLAGVSAVHLDNWTRPVGGPVINTLMTAQSWTDRILGFSKTPELPTRVTWMVSGNGLSVRADQVRRTMYLHLDPRIERPEARVFDGPPLIELITRDRVKLLSAVFTILRGYRQAGCPGQNENLLGSFEEWSRQVAGAVRWIGMPDPIQSQDILRAEDPERQKLEDVFAGLFAVFGKEPFAVRDIIRVTTVDHFQPLLGERKELAEAMTDHFSERGGVNSRALGWFLRHFKGRIAGGIRLDDYRGGVLSDGKKRYSVQEIR